MLPRERASAEALVDEVLPDRSRGGSELGHSVDHIDRQVESIEIVAHDHVERRGDGPLLLVAADVQVVVVRAAVRQTMDEPRVPVVREDDRPVDREQRVELGIGEPVRMLGLVLEAHEVDDVNEADAQVG